MKTRTLFFLFLGTTAILLISACKMYYKPQGITFDKANGFVDLAEGRRMTMLMCGPCHFDASTRKFTGMQLRDVPSFVGKVVASNITRDSVAGAGKYSDEELAYLLKTGVARNGRLMPYMQRPNISGDDLRNIIAYLRSDDNMVAASNDNPGNTKYTPIGKFGVSRSKPIAWKTELPVKPIPTRSKELGKYLVDNLACYDCHSKSFLSIDKINPEKSKGFMGGGNRLKDMSGGTILSSNLTPHPTGIGDWSEADFMKAMKQGVSRDQSIITFPMPMYSDLTDAEVNSIYDYLKSLPAIKNKISHK